MAFYFAPKLEVVKLLVLQPSLDGLNLSKVCSTQAVYLSIYLYGDQSHVHLNINSINDTKR